MKDLVIIGSGGFGREVAQLVDDINKENEEWNLLGFLDDFNTKEIIDEYKNFGSVNNLLSFPKDTYISIAIADTHARKKIADFCYENGYKFATLIHPSVIFRGKRNVGEGSIITMGVNFAINSSCGIHCIFNTTSCLGHDTVVGDYCDIMPDCMAMGDVTIGDFSYCGVRSTIIQQIKICENTTIGACACVVKNIDKPGTYVGVPAKMIKEYSCEA